MSDQLSNIRAAYRVLENRVVSALRTQLGDQLRLAAVTAQALALASAAEQMDHLLLSSNAFAQVDTVGPESKLIRIFSHMRSRSEDPLVLRQRLVSAPDLSDVELFNMGL
ncbi:hypothetical protein PILCRDRAFT_16180 [Piloderma croceum F 1598]|uniref:Uncharacterized protein n=1 Tax=Piloderma croceum (strain F 1598) TaxID=765440 RepID=A0A0C3EX89_PILCF|nr:hypothetical protein PILCRDRAFT_16180 [Piloderma croceum F 1598]